MCENILVRKIIESKLGTLLLLLVVVVEEVVYIYIHTLLSVISFLLSTIKEKYFWIALIFRITQMSVSNKNI